MRWKLAANDWVDNHSIILHNHLRSWKLDLLHGARATGMVVAQAEREASTGASGQADGETCRGPTGCWRGRNGMLRQPRIKKFI